MNSTIVVTSIYSEFWGTEQFRKSVDHIGFNLVNGWKGKGFTGHGDTLRYMYEAYKDLNNEYEYAIYADGADSYFVDKPAIEQDIILYSTEKAIWPPTEKMKLAWNQYWSDKPVPLTKSTLPSPWKYINGGGYCGPIPLLIEFFERYKLNKYKGDINGQGEQAEAFFKAKEDGFPIFLDTQCTLFQTTGFTEPDYFGIIHSEGDPQIANMITGTKPAVFHGNGRTDLKWIYDLYK